MPNPSLSSNANGIVQSNQILELLVLGNQAVEKGVLKIIDGVQDKIELPRMSINDNILQPRVATPTNSVGDLVRDGKTITPLDAMVYYRFNPRIFESDWREFQPKGPLVSKVTDPKMQKAIVSVTQKAINNQIGRLIWQGDISLAAGTPLSYFDGFLTIADASVDTIKAASIGAITAVNVLAVFDVVRDAIPDAILDEPNLRFHISTAVLRLYQQAVNDLDFKGTGPTEVTEKMFKNIELVDYSGFANDQVLACVASTGSDTNLYGAVNMSSDPENLIIERFRPESEEFFVKALFKMAVNLAWDQEAVLYKA